MEVHYSNNLINKSKKINLYIFTICNNIDTITKLLNIHFGFKSFPKTLLKSTDLFKKIYYDKYEILFIFMKKKCNHTTLYDAFGK